MRNVWTKPWPYFGIVIVYVSLYFVWQENSYLPVLDNLDSFFPYYYSLSKHQALFHSNSSLIDGMVGLQPRAVYPSEWNPVFLLSYFFGPLYGYIINFALVHFLAFWGMWGLLQYWKKETKIIKDCPDYLIGLTAVFFAVIKFWPHAGISAAGVPLLVWGLLLINDRPGLWKGYLLVFLYVFYSTLIHGGIFVLIIYFLFILYFIAKGVKRKIKINICVFIGMCLLYAAIEYRVFHSIFYLGNYLSHRTEASFSYFSSPLSGLPALFMDFLIHGQWHAGYYTRWAIIFGIAGLVIVVIKKTGPASKKLLLQSAGLLFGILFLSVFFGYKKVDAGIEQVPVIKMIQFDRFYFLLPFAFTIFLFFIWYLTLSGLKNAGIKAVFVTGWLGIIVANFIQDDNWNTFVKNTLGNKTNNHTYKEIYARNQFKDIKAFVDSAGANSRVASVGIHPAIAVMNDLKAVDGYFPNYNIISKRKIEAVIKKEIEKDNTVNAYFTKWGHRAYLFNHIHKLDFLQYKDSKNYKPVSVQLEYDFDVLKQMDCSYILSAVPIDAVTNQRLRLERVFDSDESAWRIYLYHIL